MPGYVPEALVRSKKRRPSKLQDQPTKTVPPKYGQAQQFAEGAPESVPAMAEEKTYIQQVVGTFLYYARAVLSVWGQLIIFFYFIFLCLIWHVIERCV